VQFWTSRGFTVADVDYRGSTGYGRDYRNRLRGQWGVCDVEDCAGVARWLAAEGRVDPERCVIRGGSAGGFTTLAALAFTDVFAAGASLYGVADLAALAQDTHKFESRYLDRMVGPWPEAEALYRARSPLHHLEGFDRPLILFQGLEDVIVPPAQSEMIFEAVRAKGLPVAYLAFEGEQHGFRQAETIQAVAAAELSFYGLVLGFEPAGKVDVPVENLA
jgi:dipeptidyl aminopeptidase/acylaminoacyl peptidase